NQPPLLNTHENRTNSLRISARFGMLLNLGENVTAGIRLGTGNINDPVSTTQTLGGGLTKKNIWLDQVWMAWQPTDWAKVIGGRMPNPFMSTNLVFADHLNFDGVAGKFDVPIADGFRGFATAGMFPIDYQGDDFPSTAPVKNASRDKWLTAAQIGASWKFSEDAEWKLALAYYRFDKLRGQLSSPCALYLGLNYCSTDASRPTFMQKGNSLFLIRDIIPDPNSPTSYAQPQFVGLVYDYHVANATTQLDLKVADTPLRLEGDYIRNLAYHRKDAFGPNVGLSRLVNNFGAGDFTEANYKSGPVGWMLRATLGNPNPDAPGDWNASVAYKYLQPDATVDGLNDPDFRLGGTNAKGFVLSGSYGLSKYAWLTARYLNARQVFGAPLAIDVFQLEMNARRLRDQLRETRSQLQSLQAEQSQWAAEKAALEKERDAAKQDAETARAGAKKSTGMSPEASRALAEERQRREAAEAGLQKGKADADSSAMALRTAETERARLAKELDTARGQVDACTARNVQMYRVGQEVIAAYENLDASDVLASRQPGWAQRNVKETAMDRDVPFRRRGVARQTMYPDHDIACTPEYRAQRPRHSRARAEVDVRMGGMSCLHALSEMLRQLYAARQGKQADLLMDRCSSAALEKLLGESSAFLGARVRYAVSDRLRHRKPQLDDTAMPTIRAIASVLNAWLHDGRRLAIRNVLRELSADELRELAALPELNDEVARHHVAAFRIPRSVMIVRTQSPDTRRPAIAVARPTLRRRTMCQFIALALFGGAAHAATPPAFSPAWFASKPANAASQAPQPGQGTGNAGGNVFTPGNVMLQQRVQQSIANLDAAAQAVAAQMAAQKGAQSAAQQLVSRVPNGLGDGGLKVDRNAGTDPSLWQNANQPTQTVADGRTNVEIKQTAGKAIMTWESFNVGNQTTVHFDQTGGNQTGGGNQWVALNRINDPSGKPSQILGQIKAEGTVYLLNRNGMIFGGGAQVDTHSLIASSLDLFTNDITKSNAFFLKYGIGSKTDPDQVLGNGGSVGPFLTDNGDALIPGARRGAITIEKGASINASKDGFALIAASAVNQGGRIVADDGQVFVAAAQGLSIADSATGSHMDIQAAGAAGPDGVVSNTGLIQARRGSIKLLGEDVRQDGVLVASTSLSHPGSIVFDKGSGGNTRPKVELGTGSVTTILPEKDGETTTSTQDADKAFVTSRVDVNLNATVNSGALIEVPAGNVTFARDTYVDSGAVIDVSGLANVTLPMSALLVMIPRIGLNELANSPLLRDSFLFSSKNVPIDSTRSGTRPDGLDWIGSPILNVAGYVNNVPRTVDQLMIRSGNIAFKQNAIVRTGAQLRLEGGFINYLPGYIATPRLQGANGLVYDIASADPDVQYTGFAGVYSQAHARWGVTETYVTSPILANTGRWDPGFIRGGDAGTLSFGQSGNIDRTYDLILDGDVSAHAYAGREQVRSRNLPLAGTLDIDIVDIAAFNNLSGISKSGAVNFVIQSERKPLETYKPDFSPDDPWPARGGDPSDPDNPLWWRGLSTAMIDNAGLRKVRLSTAGTVLVKDGANLHVVDGGEVDITATTVDVQGTVTAHGGAINLSARASGVNQQESVPSSIVIGGGGRLDASGLWVNDTGRGGDLLQGDR
ncbi:hypothetical protein KCV01_g11617, partial [Aureobasidium melanogenum]